MSILNMFDCKIEFNHFFIIIIKSCSTSPPGGNQVDGLPPAAVSSTCRNPPKPAKTGGSGRKWPIKK